MTQSFTFISQMATIFC